MELKERSIGLDLVKFFAIFFVLTVHFFLNTHFYSTDLIGKNMFLQMYIRTATIICVPLFLIATGYLQANKTPSKSYYKKIVPILIIYLIYSLLAILYKTIYLNEQKNILEHIASIFNFSANSYSWYINLYIGLFLLSPYLNILYKNITTKKQKMLLICILSFISALPNFLNGKVGGGVIFAPDYWLDIYPLTYYFLGLFIKEYQIKVNKFKGSIALIIIITIQVVLEFLYTNDGKFIGASGYYASLIIAIQSIVFFLLIYDMQLKSKLMRKFITLVSALSLDIYLASSITDNFIYSYVLKTYESYTQQKLLLFLPLIIFATFLLSYVISYIRHKLIRIR